MPYFTVVSACERLLPRLLRNEPGPRLNNIALLMNLGYDFKSAVSILLRMYDQHRSRMPQAELPTASN